MASARRQCHCENVTEILEKGSRICLSLAECLDAPASGGHFCLPAKQILADILFREHLKEIRLRLISMIVHDLTHPDFDPPDCPAWAREDLPPSIRPYCGRNGLPSPWHERNYALAMTVRGVDRYHANQFIVHRPETAHYLYTDYTPLEVGYRQGMLPLHEKLAAEVTSSGQSPTERAVSLLKHGTSRMRHPTMPPCGPNVRPDRNLDDESLLQSGVGGCNEQTRVFIRLCQVCGIPARLIQLFYSDGTGHCIAEFHSGEGWHMADASWFCVFPDANGHLLSAAQCHDRGEGQRSAGKAYFDRFQELLALPKESLGLGNETMSSPEETNLQYWTRISARSAETLAAEFYVFGVINYPLPA